MEDEAMVRGRIMQWLARVWLVQALYYVVSGIWPLVHLRSFEAITGPKSDGWLVKTVGALVTVVGAVLGIAGLRGRLTPEIKLLAVGAGVSLATIDVVYVVRGRIARVYLLDALAHLVILGAWFSSWRQDPRDQQ
jgi:hypothetical protein